MKKILLIICLVIQNCIAFANGHDTLKINHLESKYLTNPYFLELEDPNHTLTIKDVINNPNFHSITTTLPIFEYSKSVTWLKFILKNNTNRPYIPITIGRVIVDEFDVYFEKADHEIIHLTFHDPQYNLKSNVQTIMLINMPLLPGSSATVFARVKSSSSTVMPIEVHGADQFIQKSNTDNIINGAFIGIFIIMALYNLMLFIVVGDRSYLYYVFYIIALGVSQMLAIGYGNGFLPDDKIILNNYVFPILRVFFGYSILIFAGEFLQLKQNVKQYYKPYLFLYVLYTLPLIAVIFDWTITAYVLITLSVFVISTYLLFIGFFLYIKGYEPAKFFMVGWGLSLLALLLSIARNKGLIPYNEFTVNILIYSSIVELILFSIALADKINFYRHQKDESQLAALKIAKENERLITEQNILLENKVKERTQELIQTNQNLSVTIENLKSAQFQLIETEKMASLGQLTAGVAHEINNPINFVSANVTPLRLDFNELFELLNKYDAAANHIENPELLALAKKYKQKIDPEFVKDEIMSLLDGIEDGANRTSEIVQSLRTFSRMDELVLKPTNINTAILNTLILLRSSIPNYIEVKPMLDKLELLNCYSGKINQVLINLINNSIQAIKAKEEHLNERITIATHDYPDHISIEITDTGTGMSSDTKQRIFEPFFTTKDIGEGTGLGLSIVFGIIEKHHGTIDVYSTPGQGSTFMVKLPKNLE
ncbi:MAG TPA: 7TM diverse intracellular signaling domain-containing protein [Mucilaginibacter sp.]